MLSRIKHYLAVAAIGGLFAPTLTPAQDSTETRGRERAQDEARIAVNRARAEAEKAKATAEVRFAEAKQKAVAQVRLFQATGRSGLELAEVSDAIRAQVGLPDGQGVVVVNVRPGSVAGKSGLKPNDLLISVADKPISNVGQAREILDRKPDKDAKVKVIRGGKETVLSLQNDLDDNPQKFSKRYQGEISWTKTDQYYIGVPVSPVDATLRSHLSDLPADAGLIVNDVVKDSPAAKAGLAKNDVLVSIGGKPLTSPEVLMAQVRESDGKPLPLDYLRAGKRVNVMITPEKHDVAVAGQDEAKDLRIITFMPQVTTQGNPNWAFGLTLPARSFIGKLPNSPPLADNEALANAYRAMPNDRSTRELEAAVKDLTAKVEEIGKAVEAIRKATVDAKQADEK